MKCDTATILCTLLAGAYSEGKYLSAFEFKVYLLKRKPTDSTHFLFREINFIEYLSFTTQKKIISKNLMNSSVFSDKVCKVVNFQKVSAKDCQLL